MASRPLRSTSLRLFLLGRATGMAAAIAVIFVAARPTLAAQPAPAGGDIKILPASKGGAASAALPLPPAPREGQPGPAAAGPRMSYADAFRAVSFSRAEYMANPSYRNEAALAMMFGQMPYVQTIKNVPAPRINNFGYITPYRYRSGYGYGANYNFYYPMPSVYRHY